MDRRACVEYDFSSHFLSLVVQDHLNNLYYLMWAVHLNNPDPVDHDDNQHRTQQVDQIANNKERRRKKTQ